MKPHPLCRSPKNCHPSLLAPNQCQTVAPPQAPRPLTCFQLTMVPTQLTPPEAPPQSSQLALVYLPIYILIPSITFPTTSPTISQHPNPTHLQTIPLYNPCPICHSPSHPPHPSPHRPSQPIQWSQPTPCQTSQCHPLKCNPPCNPFNQSNQSPTLKPISINNNSPHPMTCFLSQCLPRSRMHPPSLLVLKISSRFFHCFIFGS